MLHYACALILTDDPFMNGAFMRWVLVLLALLLPAETLLRAVGEHRKLCEYLEE